ncbi:uncharacterized protein LOC123989136 [Osmia bicornis bicornis]|uniref:uncharacterized protein LOC123989136 n=1 Tax=Osmia bicornis bicornis TaxID=1437191 RepID=UPI001EAF69A9|nr:uncharacterized protein LOC123989136 [Osmia bicornis bicornis]
MLRTSAEYYNMMYVYAQCNSNANAAVRKYREIHGETNVPSAHSFRQMASRLYSTGSTMPQRREVVRDTTSRDRNTDAVLSAFERDPTMSIREASQRLDIKPTTVHKMLKDSKMHPYKYVRVHQMNPQDYIQRIQYSRWLLGEIARNPSFSKCVLWTDEALFTRDGCFNAHNSHVWSDANPLAIRTRAGQVRWSFNVWAGICGDFIVGPYLLPDRLDGPSYRVFLEHILPDLAEVIPPEIRRGMFYQHDGAPAHYATNVRAYLDEAFQDRWIGRGGPVAWPPLEISCSA